jgi:hypothetical protein
MTCKYVGIYENKIQSSCMHLTSTSTLATIVGANLHGFLEGMVVVYLHLVCANLHGFLDGMVVEPPAMITQGTGNATTTMEKPAYHAWWVQDQRVLSVLLSNMSSDISSVML